MSSQTNIIIVGGGMVGATSALALAKENFSVSLIENAELEINNFKNDFDHRVSAINRISQNIFLNLNVWPEMESVRITPYQNMRVWDKKGFGEILFDAAEIGEPNLGHILENRVVLSALWKKIIKHQNIEVINKKEILNIETHSDKKVIYFSDSSQLDGDLIIAADGANSKIRELSNFEMRVKDYRQEGLVATIKTEKGNQATAWQRFMANGPLALLPIDEDMVSMVWSTSPRQAIKLEGMENDEFEKELTLASQNCCGSLKNVSLIQKFKLKSQQVKSYVCPGVALIGDAAHVIHPLAGQGVNLGLLDVGVLVETLVTARNEGRDLGSLNILRRYDRIRKSHNAAVNLAMDFFYNTFSNDKKSYFFIRNSGLKITNRVKPMKNLFMKIALGSISDSPGLGRYSSY
tara:strand:- start:1315 stop:2532 length:1218 start_codon:yes stop_codon:yes gene_type:complete